MVEEKNEAEKFAIGDRFSFGIALPPNDAGISLEKGADEEHEKEYAMPPSTECTPECTPQRFGQHGEKSVLALLQRKTGDLLADVRYDALTRRYILETAHAYSASAANNFGSAVLREICRLARDTGIDAGTLIPVPCENPGGVQSPCFTEIAISESVMNRLMGSLLPDGREFDR